MDPEIINDLFNKHKEYYNYLKENSEWLKLLRRDKKYYKDFIKYIKTKYKLRPQDKAKNTLDNLGVLSEVLSNLK